MSSLNEEFTRDHRKLTQGFLAVAKAIENDQLDEARVLADELDQVAGPHIAFEEEFLYPHVSKVRGKPYATKLYDEHAEILRAIQELQQGREMSADQQKQMLNSMRVGLEHAATCGTLLSHLAALPSQTQAHLLDEYLKLKHLGKRWTQLATAKS